MNNFTSLTTTEKKAAAYDLLGQIEYLQKTLLELHQSIAADMQATASRRAEEVELTSEASA